MSEMYDQSCGYCELYKNIETVMDRSCEKIYG